MAVGLCRKRTQEAENAGLSGQTVATEDPLRREQGMVKVSPVGLLRIASVYEGNHGYVLLRASGLSCQLTYSDHMAWR